MHNIRISLVLFILIFFGSVSESFAQSTVSFPFRQGVRVILNEDEVVERDFFITGEQVEIKGTINGDLYVAGGEVTVSGTVNGDVLVAGGQIEISGNVAGDVRAFGGDIQIEGNVGKNLTGVGGNIQVSDTAIIKGSTVFGAGNVDIVGKVSGNIIGGIGNLAIANTVGGGVYTGVGQIKIEEGGNIAGNVVYWSDEKAIVASEATVSGTIDHRIPVEQTQLPDRETWQSAWAGFRFLSLLSMLVIGLLIVRFFPGLLETGGEFLKEKPWQAFGLGFVKLIIEPIVAIILMITLVGFPLGVFLIFAYIAALYFSSYIVASWLGRLIWSKFSTKNSPYLAFIIGALVFVLVTNVPIVGGLLRFISLVLGLGGILLLKYSWYKKIFMKAK